MMKCDRAEVLFYEDDELCRVTLCDVTLDDEDNVTGTLIWDDFPGCYEEITIPADKMDAFYGEDFT